MEHMFEFAGKNGKASWMMKLDLKTSTGAGRRKSRESHMSKPQRSL